ncbi:MAG: hypothetical protein IJ996_03195 [Clostridia bacterium]|nr:hypothetical protein [Clostridia bacterium]
MGRDIFKTGFRGLDERRFGGIKRGEFVAIYTSAGMETAFLSQMLVNMLSYVPSVKCLYFTLGGSKEVFYNKLACIKNGVEYERYGECKNRTEKDVKKINQARQWLKEKLCEGNAKSLVIDNVYTIAEIVLCVAEAKTSFGVDVVFIDELRRLRDYANEDIRYALSILKELSTRLNISVIVDDYFRYDGNLSRIEQIQDKHVFREADKVILSIRPGLYTAKQMENDDVEKEWVDFYILKNQTGDIGCFSLKFDFRTFRFYDPRDKDLDEQEPAFEDGDEYFIEKED